MQNDINDSNDSNENVSNIINKYICGSNNTSEPSNLPFKKNYYSPIKEDTIGEDENESIIESNEMH